MRNREFTLSGISDFEETMNLIPAEILALPGYGWSAGTAKNWIDWENKKYHQEVTQVVIDGTTKTVRSDVSGADYYRFVCDLSEKILNHQLGISAPVAYDINVVEHPGTGLSNDAVYILTTSGVSRLYFVSKTSQTNLQTAEQANTWLQSHPITVNYALETPIETDISALLDDNHIRVESGGTITFENSLGDSFRIPVPSTVLTMQDTQESEGEGE